MNVALKRVALVLFGLLLVLGALEGAFRLAGIGGPAELGPTYDRPPYGFVPHPDRQHPWTTGAGPVFKVAAIGDSFTTGFGNEWTDGYPRRLELLLNLTADAVPAEVRVFAQNGTTTWQQLKFLDQALDWGAELVLLGLFINDTEDHRDADLEALQEAMRTRVPTGLARRVLRASRALAWIYARFEEVRRYRAALAKQERVFDPDYSGWKAFRRAVRKFKAACRERDARLVAVIWPSMGGLGPAYPQRFAHERMAEVLREAKIPYLDLLPEFESKSSLRLTVYPEVDNHPNEIGHRIGADAIFWFLLEGGHIDPSYRPAKNRVSGEGHFLGRVRRRQSPEHYPE